MRIPQSFIDEVKYRNKIEDVIASYVNLKRAGSNYQGFARFTAKRRHPSQFFRIRRPFTASAAAPAET